jgi:hypothetical protein
MGVSDAGSPACDILGARDALLPLGVSIPGCLGDERESGIDYCTFDGP